MMSEVADHLAELLAHQGIALAFGVTGSGLSWSLASSLERRNVPFVPVAHEASGAFMAGAVFRSTGKLAAALSIKGPGLANMIPGITYNCLEGNAAVTISEAYGAEVPRFKRHKRIDHSHLLKSIVKGACTLNRIDDHLPMLLSMAISEVPGPVHVDLHNDAVAAPVSAPRRRTAESGSDDLLRAVEAAARPIVVAGSLASRRPWGKRLASLRVPVFTTAATKGLINERLANSAGVFTGDGKQLAPETELFPLADLIVGLGLRNTEVLSPRSYDCPMVLVDEIDDGLGDGFSAVHHVVWADLPDRVCDCLDLKQWGTDLIARSRRRLLDALTQTTWSPAVCFAALNEIGFDYAMVLDTGLFCTVGEHMWMAGSDRPFLGSGNARFMGASIPSAIGLSLANPGLPVLCVTGDGGIRPYVAELKIAIEDRLPLCVVLMTDGRYGSIAAAQRDRSASRRAVEICNPSWRQAIEGMGCEARQVSSLTNFEAAITGWSRGEPLFLEAPFNPRQYAELTKDLR
jgi:acetolactate synthase-1/2/3 large subunit